MKAARGLAGDKQVLDVAFRAGIDLHTTVLIVQRGVNQDRILADIDAESLELEHHSRKMLFHRPGPMFRIQ